MKSKLSWRSLHFPGHIAYCMHGMRHQSKSLIRPAKKQDYLCTPMASVQQKHCPDTWCYLVGHLQRCHRWPIQGHHLRGVLHEGHTLP